MREQQVFEEFAARLALPVDRLTSSATPDSADNGCHCAASKVSGTSAGRGSTFQAELARDLQAEIGGAQLRDRHAAGRHDQLGRTDEALAGAQLEALLAVGDLGHRTAHAPGHPASSHSARSSPMMDSLESSQNSWPRCFSCQDTRWRLSSARKSCGV